MTKTRASGTGRSTKTSSGEASTGASPVTAAASEYPAFGWRPLRNDWDFGSDEQAVVDALAEDNVHAGATGGRNQSHDIHVLVGTAEVGFGYYEVKRLSVRPNGHTVDRRFKLGRRGESLYGRRDAEIKSFAAALEQFLDECRWGVEAVTQTHDFIDQAYGRRHGKKFMERLKRLATSGTNISSLLFPSQAVLTGGINASDIRRSLGGLEGVFVIADHIYTLVKPSEYTQFFGFDSASAEGPKLAFLGVVPLKPVTEKKRRKS